MGIFWGISLSVMKTAYHSSASRFIVRRLMSPSSGLCINILMYPILERQKKPHKYNSLPYHQSGFKITERKGLYLSKIGYIRMFMHRPLLGDIRRLTIKREADEWYAVFI